MAKPSVLAQFIYGSASKLDYLAYYNGFSNPFAIPVGFILRVPLLTKLQTSIGRNVNSNNSNIARDLLNKKKNVVDEKRKRAIITDVERPNMNTSLRQNIVLQDRIVLGTNSIGTSNMDSITGKLIEEPDDQIYGLTDYYEEKLLSQ